MKCARKKKKAGVFHQQPVGAHKMRPKEMRPKKRADFICPYDMRFFGNQRATLNPERSTHSRHHFVERILNDVASTCFLQLRDEFTDLQLVNDDLNCDPILVGEWGDCRRFHRGQH